MQIIKGPEYFRQSENNRIRLVSEEACRGTIYDRNGTALCKNKLVFDVVAVLPEKIRNKDFPFIELGKILNINPEILLDTYYHNFKSSFYPVMLLENVPKDVAFRIEQDRTRLPGIVIKPRAMRYYIYKNTTAHIMGYLGKMHEDELAEFKKYGYQIKDIIGRSGIEKNFNDVLRGQLGGMQVEVDCKGCIIRVLSYRPPVRGKDLYLTINIELQNFIAELVNDRKGAVSVMDAQTGEIFALYSGPSYEPNILVENKNDENIEQIFRDKNAPLLNRNLCFYPAGSIFKIITAYAGLVKGEINSQTALECSGVYKIGKSAFRCWLENGHGNLTIEKALAVSCNGFFYKLGLKLGEQNLYKYAKEFGLGELTGIELPGEKNGIVPNMKWKKTKLNRTWFAGDTLNFSIGQGYLLITPLQALKAVALVANDGKEVLPHILKKEHETTAAKQILSGAALKIVQKGMRKVTNRNGTGYRVAIDGIDIFAKTGTAQASGGSPHAWFVGYTILKNKKICFVVFLEHGGHGGEKAADIAKQILLYIKDSPVLF